MKIQLPHLLSEIPYVTNNCKNHDAGVNKKK